MNFKRTWFDFCCLAEEEWIEEQLAINPDFDPNDEATNVNSSTDEQQQQPSTVNESAAQNETSDTTAEQQTGADGENSTTETRPKPKRYVNFDALVFFFLLKNVFFVLA